MATLARAVAPRGRRSAEELLAATSALMIARNGIDISFSDIAQRSGLNAALIRYHFGSKAGLYRALLDRDVGGALAELEELARSPIDAAEKLRRHVKGAVRIYERYPYLNRLVAVLGEAGEGEWVADRFTRPLIAAQRRILEQGMADGVFRTIDPMLFHFSMIGACDHLFTSRHALALGFGVDRIGEALCRAHAEEVTAMILRGVLRAPQAL